MAKSADAFRTISEVADWLETPAHVLRFWESKFSQVKPVKRAGGRRYYRPADMKLLGGIKKLLHDDGMTIKGVQKMLREQGVSYVADFSQPLGDAADDVVIDAVEDRRETEPTPTAAVDTTPSVLPSDEGKPGDSAASGTTGEAPTVPEPEEPPIAFTRRTAPAASEPEPDHAEQPESTEEAPPLPSFLQRREAPQSSPTSEQEPLLSEDEPAAPAPRIPEIDVPADPEDGVAADPGVLTLLSKIPRPLSPETADRLKTLAEQLRASSGPTPGD